MAILSIHGENTVLKDSQEVSQFLSKYGIWYQTWEESDSLDLYASEEEILAAYDRPIQQLMKEGGYTTADVINIHKDTPNLDTMLNKFNKEHWHNEDEVRFIVKGKGLFHIHPQDNLVFSIEVVAGDMINIPKGTHHWFDLCEDLTIRAIRLFQNKSGWTPHYTKTNLAQNYQPLCWGPSYIPEGSTSKHFDLEVNLNNAGG